MNNYLQGLPFNAGQGNSSDCDCPGQAFDPAKFKLYSQADRLPTFVLRLPPQGAVPDITYAGECLRIFTCDMKEMVANLTQDESGYQISKDQASYYLTYNGDPIEGLNLECGKCYRIKLMSYWSEPFWITDIPQSKVTLEFTNKSQLGDVPYQPPLNFVNRIIVDGEICGLDAELFENKKTEGNGKETITFQMLTERKQLFIYNAPEFIQKLIKSIPIHEKFTVTHKAETLTPLFKRSTVDSTKNGCCDYDLTITLPLRDLKNIGGKCDSDTDGTLTPVAVPDDMPDACEIDDDFLPTDETICLEFNKVPPPIDPPITPVGTPPVGAPCPPQGTVVNSNTQTVSCESAFIFEGLRYKKKVTKNVADGNCGTTPEIQYVEQCQDDLVTHTISNVVCESVVPVPPVGTPPVGTPPVGTPPVGTPPVGTPPVGTPPVGTPPVGTPPPTNEAIGVYSATAGGRIFLYNKAPEFDIQFNSDGSISDVSAGLDTSGPVNIQGGKNIFYMLDYNYHEGEGSVVGKLQNIILPDNPFTIRKFFLDPTKYSTMAQFKASRTNGGYNTTGVNSKNGYVAEIWIKIDSENKIGQGLAPKQLVLSRKLNWLDFTVDQDWASYNKNIGVTWMNRGDTNAQYIQKGVMPNFILGQPQGQPNTWLTFKIGQNEVKNSDQFYQLGKDYMTGMAKSPRSVYSSEYMENAQGQGGPDYYNITAHAYRGALDAIRESHPGIDVLDTGLAGEYGGEDFFAFFDKNLLYADRATWELAMTDKIYKGYNINGFTTNDHDYLVHQIDWRNVNAKYYFFNQNYNFSLEFININERTKLATKTYQGQDRERKVFIFGATSIESFVIDDQGNNISIEQSKTGEIIPYQNGEIWQKFNSQPASPWGASFEMGYWSTLITGNCLLWDAPNAKFGTDKTKLNWWSDQYIRWRPNGGNWGTYTPGQNGAPLNDNNGMIHSMFPSSTDALIAGRNAVWEIRDRIGNLRFAPYESSRGSFTPTPGTTGLHLNGKGKPVNWELFCVRDIIDQKCGLGLRGDGVVIYKNEFLAPNLYEDNVTVDGYNIGRVYGGQTAHKLI